MKSKKKNPIVVMGMVGMMSVVFLIYVWGKVDLVRVGYELERLSHQKTLLQREHDKLQLELSKLTAPNQIASEAEKRLGLLPPMVNQVVVVSMPPGDPLSGSENLFQEFVTVAKNIPAGR